MNKKIRTAVIVAGGLGTRFPEETQDKPKGFIEIFGTPLIERSTRQLLAHGISRLFIGTGYLAEHYETFAQRFPEITCIRSDRYTQTSSMYTLYNMRHEIKDDFLLLESDLLYADRALECLLEDARQDVILGSSATSSGDEVYLETSDDRLVAVSKNPARLRSLDAELVGISKVSIPLYEKMCLYYESVAAELPKLDYELAMMGVAHEYPIWVKKEENLPWCEIDTPEHYERATHEIWPRL
ncbi:MAG: phosphocholine cytidylyltransferase family protein [Planctomycetia bacterium]|nr:phosphocholine cytidylyltransferase family protein [Planctomycetia bacterium]